MQRIAPSLAVAIQTIELTDAATRQSERECILKNESSESFDLAHDPLLRARLLKFADDQHELILTLHHIVCDGWSIGVLLRELIHLYLDGADGLAVPQLPIQYADFADWQRQLLQAETIDRQLEYWKQKLAELPAT